MNDKHTTIFSVIVAFCAAVCVAVLIFGVIGLVRVLIESNFIGWLVYFMGAGR